MKMTLCGGKDYLWHMRTYFIIFLNYQFLRVINLEKNAVDRRITEKGEAITRYLSRKDFVSFCFVSFCFFPSNFIVRVDKIENNKAIDVFLMNF